MKSASSPFSIDSQKAESGDFFSLLKPGVMSLVVFTGLTGALLAPHSLHPFLLFTAILAIAMGSGAAGALNMWYDRDIDTLMKRTQKRAIPQGRIAPDDALGFGVILSFASVILLGLSTNWKAAGLLAFSIFFYVVIYTFYLKRKTPQNIVIGGAAGAFPPMIGWLAVEGSLSVKAVLLFLIIFLWTPSHFWALALYRSDDYKKANVPMLPVVKGIPATKRQIWIYSLLLAVCTLAPVAFHYFSYFYGTAALLLNSIYLIYAYRVLKTDQESASRTLFGYSILYLFLLFSALLIDHFIST